MIYAYMNGQRVTNLTNLRHVETNPNIKEIKDVDNHSCGDMFRLGTRVKFKETQKGWNQ